MSDERRPRLVSVPSLTDAEIDAIIGNPPDWYFPLVGKIAIEMGLLESWLVRCAFRLHYDRAPNDQEEQFWLTSHQRISTLVELAGGKDGEYDVQVKQWRDAATRRNQAVHVLINWSDERGASGWAYSNPKSGKEVVLDTGAELALRTDHLFIAAVVVRLLEIFQRLDGGS